MRKGTIVVTLLATLTNSATIDKNITSNSRLRVHQKQVNVTVPNTNNSNTIINVTNIQIPCSGRLKDILPNEKPHVFNAITSEDIINTTSNNETSVKTANRAKVSCSNGKAGEYSCSSVNLYSMLDTSALNSAIGPTFGTSDQLNDIWGWRSLEGREFAIVGMVRGTAFVEITNPVNPIYLGVLPAHNEGSSQWRDFKTFRNYVYIVSEQRNHGLQIFDLEILLSASPNTEFSETAHYDGFGNAHNVFINEDSGYLYSVGSNTCIGGLHMVDLNQNAENPTFAECFSDDGYTHDVQCVIYKGSDTSYADREICFASNEDTVTIIDVTNKANPVQLSRTSYSNAAYTHQGWLTEDHNYFVFDDELDEIRQGTRTKTLVLNVKSLTAPQYLGFHSGTTNAIDHNQYIKDNHIYQANYRAGLQVLRINDISNVNLEEVASFDIDVASNSASFNGAWSVYPFFESGTVIVSGIEQGLFVLEVELQTFFATPAPTSSPTPAQLNQQEPTPYPTERNPTPHPTHGPMTPFPTHRAPTPHPTERRPTPYPTGKNAVQPTVAECKARFEFCTKAKDCCKKKCNKKKKFCKK